MEVVGANGARSKQAIAVEVWRMMAEFSLGTFQRGQHIEMLKELGLTPGHLKVLSALEPDEPRAMGVIADACHCDPSMATWLVDRLEERGLVERRMLASDRRVKTVVLTSFGVTTKERLFDLMFDPPAELLSLDKQTLESLRRELTKLPSGARPSFRASLANETLKPARPRG